MGLFDDLSLKRDKNSDLVIKYDQESLLVIRTRVAKKILKDYISKKFLDEISTWSVTTSIDAETIRLADELNAVYTQLKTQFYDNKNLKKINNKTKGFKDLIKSAKLIQEFQTTTTEFVHAQIDGLSFAHTFPKPTQLHGEGAQQRFLDYVHKKKISVELETETKKLYITKTDKETPVRENPKWLDIYEKMKNEEATYLEVKFIADVQLLRSGRISPEIQDALDELKPKRRRKKR